MSNFLRQKYKEKPAAWGSFESVQRSLAINAERIGIDYDDIALAMPMWNPGNQIDYSPKIFIIPIGSGNLFTKNSLSFPGIGTTSLLYTPSLALLNEPLTLMTKLLITNLSTYGFIPFVSSNGAFYYQIDETRNVFVQSKKLGTLPSFKLNEHQILTFMGDVNTSKAAFYLGGDLKLESNIALTNASNSTYIIGGYSSASAWNLKGSIDHLFLYKKFLKPSQIATLSDNLYQLWQRQPEIFFSMPSGGGSTYDVSCADIINISESIGRNATYSASCAESMNLTAIGGKRADLKALALDNVDFQSIASNICNFTAIISSQLSFSDSSSLGTTLQAILSDNINITDSNTAISTIMASVSDDMALYDVISIIGTFNPSTIDNVALSDVLSIVCSFNASTADTISISDIVNWGSVKQALAESGINFNDATLATLLFYASIADNVSLSDSNSVNITYNVNVADTLAFSDTVSKIAMLQAIITEQFNINDVSMEVSQLPHGKCSISFTMRVPGTGITQSLGNIDFTMKTATITFNLI